MHGYPGLNPDQIPTWSTRLKTKLLSSWNQFLKKDLFFYVFIDRVLLLMCLRRFRGTENVCYSLKSKLLTHRTYTKPIAYNTALKLKKNR